MIGRESVAGAAGVLGLGSGFAGPLFPTMPPGWQSAVGPTGNFGGGGGGGSEECGNIGNSSPGGGGQGSCSTNAQGTNGIANTGGGGGGMGSHPGAFRSGGDGVVIIRYTV